MANRISFRGGAAGEWRVVSMTTLCGEPLQEVEALALSEASASGVRWVLSGVASHVRYATRPEITALAGRQEGLGRSDARCAALIPIRKSPDWWRLAQDERRAIFAERSRHGAIGFAYLPAVARQLYQSRDLGEPYDFLTWFEFAPGDAGAFDDLLARLRATEEWRYVEAESEIRLER